MIATLVIASCDVKWTPDEIDDTCWLNDGVVQKITPVVIQTRKLPLDVLRHRPSGKTRSLLFLFLPFFDHGEGGLLLEYVCLSCLMSMQLNGA